MDKKPQVQLCGLWEKTDKNGNVYFTGSLGSLNVVAFKNTYKKPGDKQPDYRVLLSEKDKEGQEKLKAEDDPFT